MGTRLIHWREERLPFVVALSKCGVGNSRPASPLSEAVSFPVVCNDKRLLLILALNFLCGPSAILRGIRSIVISAIQCETVKARTHIRQECFKRIHPSLAHGNSATSISFKVLMIWLAAAVSRTFPRVIFSGARLSVCPISFRSLFCRIASATGGATRREMASTDGLNFPAFAFAAVIAPLLNCFIDRQYFKSSKALSGKVGFVNVFLGHAVHPFVMNGWLGPVGC